MTDIRTDLSSLAGTESRHGSGAAESVQVGSYRGQPVNQLPNQSSLVQNAAEELTELLSEKEEKDLSKRDVEEGSRSDSLERVMAIREIQELLEVLADLPSNALKHALKQLLQRHSSNPDELGRHAREQFDDPSHQFALLKAYEGALRERGASEQEAARAALAQLEAAKGPEIRAGINVTAVAQVSAGDGLADIQTLRDTYRLHILGYSNMSDAFAALVKKYGEKDVEKAVRFLLNGLGADLESAGASIDKARLNAILDEMYRLKVMTGMLEQCNGMAQRVRGSGGRPDYTGTGLLADTLKFQDVKWLTPEKIGALPEKAGVSDLERQINFLTEFKSLARDIPEKAYVKTENRDRFLDAIQRTMDEFIEREDDLE